MATEKAKLKAVCRDVLSSHHCPKAVKSCCRFLHEMLSYKDVETHTAVHCCRDVASRCGCDSYLSGRRGQSSLCFRLCDALDTYCHQRISLPDAMKRSKEGKASLMLFPSSPASPASLWDK